jgi:BA14K-like protein
MKFIVYVAILLVAAAGLALGLDLLTAPPKKLEANAAKPVSAAVRQIPITQATAQENVQANGDPNRQLTPIYPAAPGKDLPIKDTPVQAAAKEPPVPATNGSAPPAPLSVPAQTVASGGACNVDACTAAYRSFRASDCSYQPFEGERKFCDATGAGPAQAASATTPIPPPQASAPPARQEPSAQAQKTQEQKDLEAAIRTVRSLPPPSMRDNAREVVVEEPYYGERYAPRQRWIIEQR